MALLLQGYSCTVMVKCVDAKQACFALLFQVFVD